MISQQAALIIVAIVVISVMLWLIFGREDCTACMYECSIEGDDKKTCAKRCLARGLSCAADVQQVALTPLSATGTGGMGGSGGGIQRHGLGYGGGGIQRQLGVGGGGIQQQLGVGGGGQQQSGAGYGASVQQQAAAAPAAAAAGSADSLESDHLAYGIGDSPYYG
jgi:hypothetical protein